MKLKGQKILLRPVEKEDAVRLMLWENEPDHWKVTGTEVPFSLSTIHEYIAQAQHIRAHGQLRLMICEIDSGKSVGTIDLYNADFKHHRAAVGILIADSEDRQKGFANEALVLIEQYADQILALKQIHCSIHGDNEASIRLFEQAGYIQVGRRKDWFFEKGKWLDEILYQKCLKKD